MKKKRKKPWRALSKLQNHELQLRGITSSFDKRAVKLTLVDRSGKKVELWLENGYHLKADRQKDRLFVSQDLPYPVKYTSRLAASSCDFIVNSNGEGIGIGDIRDVGRAGFLRAIFDLTVSKLELFWDFGDYLGMFRLKGEIHKPILEIIY